jgi:hypothetical protein
MKEDRVIEHELIMWFELKNNLLMISKKTWIIFKYILFVNKSINQIVSQNIVVFGWNLGFIWYW